MAEPIVAHGDAPARKDAEKLAALNALYQLDTRELVRMSHFRWILALIVRVAFCSQEEEGRSPYYRHAVRRE